jgi:hypothetical protein
MATTPFDIIAGPADLYVAATGASFPAVNLPDTDGSFASWTKLGMTSGGVKGKHTQTVDLVQADQRTGPVKAYRSAEGLEITTSLLEITLENFARALMDTVTAVTQEVQVLTLTSDPSLAAFTLTWNGVSSASFVKGTNQTAALIQASLRTVTGDATLTVTGTTDAGPFTITNTAGFTPTFPFIFVPGTNAPTGTFTRVVANKSFKTYRGLDATGFMLLVRGPSPYGNFFLQYQVPIVVQTDEPEISFMRDGTGLLAIKLTALEDPSAATPADRFGSIVAQTS